MSTHLERLPWLPGCGWWVMLAAVLSVGLIGNWAIAAGLLLVLLVQVARPLDFLVAFILVAGGATFVSYVTGQLTFELSMLTAAILLMLACYVLSNRGQLLAISRTSLTWPLLLYLLLSVGNAARGIGSGYSLKNIGLELYPVFALGSALLVANAFERRRDLRLAVLGLLAIGIANAAVDLSAFRLGQMHAQGVYDAPVPGIVGLLLVNLSLRSKKRVVALGWIALSLPLFLQQFLTYGRGLWLGCLAGLVVSLFVFAGFGRASATRWARSGLVIATLLVVGGGIAMRQANFLQLAGSRLGSITNTKFSYETASTVARLMEYSTVLEHIGESPWLGHGVGYSFLATEPIAFKVGLQWWVHQNYLWVWLKQGVVGLGVFLWMLWSAVAFAVREAGRREDPWEATWFATSAAGTVLLAVLGMTNFPLAQINPTFTLALLWGGSMAMARQGFVRFGWMAPDHRPEPR